MKGLQVLIVALFLFACVNGKDDHSRDTQVNYETIYGEGPTGCLIRRTTTTVTVVEEFASCDCDQGTTTPSPWSPDTTTTPKPWPTWSTPDSTTTSKPTIVTDPWPTWSTPDSTTTIIVTDTTTPATPSTTPDLYMFCQLAETGKYYNLPNDSSCHGYVYCGSSGPIVNQCSNNLYFHEDKQTCSSVAPDGCDVI